MGYRTTGAAVCSDAPPRGLGTAAAAGTAAEVSRADHIHPLPKLDGLLPPDDSTDLDVSTSRHGLVPKAPNDPSRFLRGDGTWAVPGSSGGVSIGLVLALAGE